MPINRKYTLAAIMCFLAVLAQACNSTLESTPTATPYEEIRPIPQITLPSTLSGLIVVLKGEDDVAKIGAARVLASMGPEAELAVPALTQNLYSNSSEVRRVVAEALGEIGPTARSSVPALIVILLADPFVHARSNAATALGKIERVDAVPALATALMDEHVRVQISSAISIALLTGQEFPDLNVKGGYSLDENGVPIIVIAAREWWEEEGRYQDWLE